MSDEIKSDAIVTQALERYKLGVDAIQKQVDREKDDLRCQVPELMWPDDVASNRKASIAAGIPLPPRPMLSIPSLDQPVQLVLNQEKAAHLGVEVHALSQDADDDTAEVLQGLYRRIEVNSRANNARSWAYERAVKCGRGAYRILTEYTQDGGHLSDQDIVIKRILHQEAVIFDPFAQESDWSDGRWAFVTQWEPWDRYKRKYPKSTLSRYDESEFSALLSDAPDWVKGDGESRAVLTAEYFCLEYESKKRVQFTDGSDGYDSDSEGREIDAGVSSRTEEVPKLCWYKLNAVEVLETEERDGRYIPLVPVVGRELQPFDTERRWTGIYTNNKQSAQMLNYAASGLVEAGALETKASHVIDPEAFENHEVFWQQKNIRNFPYLPYTRFKNGRDLGPPEPIQADTSKMQVNMLLLDQARQFIHSGTGAFEPSLGQESPNQRSGKAVLALQQQHEQGNSHFLDNLAEISMTYEAKVVLDLIPYVYDRPGRVARLLDGEGNPNTVMLNQPFVMQGKRPMPVQGNPTPATPMAGSPQPTPQGPPQPDVKHYDLKKGRYGVVVNIGKAYDRRAAEGQDKFGQLFQAEPQLFMLLGDLYLKNADFPGSQEAAKRMERMLPPQARGEEEQTAAAQIPHLQAQLQQMGGQLKEAAQIIQTKQVEQQAKIATTKIQASTQIQLQMMKDATTIAAARITAAKEALDATREDGEEAVALAQTQTHDANQAALDRQHEMAMAQQQHQQALQQAQQAHEQATAQAEQEHGQALVQGEQGQQHALEQGDQSNQAAMAQQQQAADLAPEPASGE